MRNRIKSNRVCITYPNGVIKFLTIIILGIVMMSCNSQTNRGAQSDAPSIGNRIICDDAFINNINSFDSTAVIHDLYLEPNGETNILCIVIEQHDSLFLYKGVGSYMRRFYLNNQRGYTFK